MAPKYSRNLCLDWLLPESTAWPFSYGIYEEMASEDKTYQTQYAFDGDPSTEWRSYLTGAEWNVAGNDFIGYQFDRIPATSPREYVKKHIRKIHLTQSAGDNSLTSVVVQRSNQGETNYFLNQECWSTVAVINDLEEGFNEILLPPSTPSHSWRILTNSNPKKKWGVISIEMFEMINDPTTVFYGEKVSVSANGQPISSESSYDPLAAFDGTRVAGNLGGQWRSKEYQDDLIGNSYIGYSYKVERQIRSISISHSFSPPDSVLVQSSDDGRVWTTVSEWTQFTRDEKTSLDFIQLPDSPAKKHWRLLANANVGGAWIVFEVEMFEILDIEPPISTEPEGPIEPISLYNSVTKLYKGIGELETEMEELPVGRKSLFIYAEHKNATFKYSLDDGLTWYNAIIGEVTDITSKLGNALKIRVVLPVSNASITALSYAWA